MPSYGRVGAARKGCKASDIRQKGPATSKGGDPVSSPRNHVLHQSAVSSKDGEADPTSNHTKTSKPSKRHPRQTPQGLWNVVVRWKGLFSGCVRGRLHLMLPLVGASYKTPPLLPPSLPEPNHTNTTTYIPHVAQEQERVGQFATTCGVGVPESELKQELLKACMAWAVGPGVRIGQRRPRPE